MSIACLSVWFSVGLRFLRLAEDARKICNDLGDTRTEATCLHAYASAHDIIEQPPGHMFFKVRQLKRRALGRVGLYLDLMPCRGLAVLLLRNSEGTTSASRRQRMPWTCTWICKIRMLKPSNSAAWRSGS